MSLVEIENVSVIKALNYWQHEQQLSSLLCSIFMKCWLCTFYFESGLQNRYQTVRQAHCLTENGVYISVVKIAHSSSMEACINPLRESLGAAVSSAPPEAKF